MINDKRKPPVYTPGVHVFTYIHLYKLGKVISKDINMSGQQINYYFYIPISDRLLRQKKMVMLYSSFLF